MSRNEKKALNAILEESGENELARMRHQVFETARAALKDPRDAEVLHWVEDLTKALSGTKEAAAVGSNVAEACFSPGESCRQQILTLLRRAVKKADICVFTITDNEISDQILRTHQRGVKVRVITDDDKSLDRGSDIERLGKKGVEICFDGTPFHMHHKYAIFDAQTLLTGSYNWTRSAATRNEENILVTDDRRFVGPYQNHFDGLWSKLRGSR
jgi:phosphatidylserine/phosphatidylglycerophosphate/cardiolipin synthase-like enzyme